MNSFLIPCAQLILKYLKNLPNLFLYLFIGIFLFQLNFVYLDLKLIGMHFIHGFLVEIIRQMSLLHPEEVHKVPGVKVRGYSFQLVQGFNEELQLSFLVLKALVVLKRVENTLSMQYTDFIEDNLSLAERLITCLLVHGEIRKRDTSQFLFELGQILFNEFLIEFDILIMIKKELEQRQFSVLAVDKSVAEFPTGQVQFHEKVLDIFL